MAAHVPVALPSGHFDGSTWHREAALAPLTGADEAFLLESATHLPPARRTTALLARCVRRIGGLDDITQETIRGLRVGDREALLLALRRLTFGERIDALVRCPAPGCGEPLDLELSIGDLLVREPPAPEPAYERRLGDGAWRVRFRLPTGADQEHAADSLDRHGEEGTADRMLRACVEAVAGDAASGEAFDAALPALRRDLPAIMAGLDPQAETWIDLACPDCGAAVPVFFDAAAHLFAELHAARESVFDDVHALAAAHHWSEGEIMALPRRRRRRYAERLAEAKP